MYFLKYSSYRNVYGPGQLSADWLRVGQPGFDSRQGQRFFS